MDLIKIRMQALEDGYFYYSSRKKLGVQRNTSKSTLSDLEQFFLDNNASIEDRERIMRELAAQSASQEQFPMDERREHELREQDYQDQLRDERWAEEQYTPLGALQERILEADLYRIGY